MTLPQSVFPNAIVFLQPEGGGLVRTNMSDEYAYVCVHVCMCERVHWFARPAVAASHKLGGLSNRNLLSHGLETRRVKPRCRQWSWLRPRAVGRDVPAPLLG